MNVVAAIGSLVLRCLVFVLIVMDEMIAEYFITQLLAFICKYSFNP